jgi:ubiquitin carboxyl-terminal hydrolase 14
VVSNPRLLQHPCYDECIIIATIAAIMKLPCTASQLLPLTAPIVAAVAAGRYELTGVLTHKGRSADSGHYVAWTKQADGKWVLFDDDELHFKTAEDVLALNGGGDWHMAYLLMYKAVTVPEAAVPAAAAAKPEAAVESQPEPMKAE